MTETHRLLDHLVFAFLLIVPLVEWRWSWPRYLRRLATGAPGIRLRYLRSLAIGEWVPALVLLGAWAISGRPWRDIYLTAPLNWRMAGGLAYAAVLVAVLVVQRRMILKRPEAIERVRKMLKYAEPLLPHTPAERKTFWLVSITAGVCEEFFYRGFLTWYLTVWIGLVPAILLSTLIFGASHVYLGALQIPRTALAGLVFAGLAWASGSLWPAMVLHAAMDWNSGELGFRIPSEPRDDAAG